MSATDSGSNHHVEPISDAHLSIIFQTKLPILLYYAPSRPGPLSTKQQSSMWNVVGYFWTAFIANAVLLWLQTSYVKQTPGSIYLSYRFVQTCILGLLFTISLILAIGPWLGLLLQRRTSKKRAKIVSGTQQQTVTENEEILNKKDSEWKDIIGFFHPFWYVSAVRCIGRC